MEPLLDRSRIERLVRTTLEQLGDKRSVVDDGESGLLLPPDRGVNLSPFDADAMAAMLRSTPARIGVGRAGTRYKTNTLLRFRADHAAAKDAVVSEVDAKLVARLGLVELTTRAPDKRIFLERPDAGRALSDDGRARLADKCVKAPEVQVCYGDGLSAAAINAHLEAFHGALMPALQARGFRVGTPLFVRRSRVKVMDEIARLLDAEACVFTCGERPGLGFADSLSSYYIYRPATGATDADREVISNINPRGLPPTKAAHAVADACARILAAKKSGVVI
ncbi:MAG TPA: ethanolamine ammonia-lyase subunit EutC [Polyangia bacterium]|jgi:ethanolamine ammonia-lyase small subunit|nr:ethanolamine ammonia-lyase subunit EutC [Polyangia bacterium]